MLRVSAQGLIDRAVAISSERDISLARAMSIAQTELDRNVNAKLTRIKVLASKRLDRCAQGKSVDEARRILSGVGSKLRRHAA